MTAQKVKNFRVCKQLLTILQNSICAKIFNMIKLAKRGSQ